MYRTAVLHALECGSGCTCDRPTKHKLTAGLPQFHEMASSAFWQHFPSQSQLQMRVELQYLVNMPWVYLHCLELAIAGAN